MNTNPTNNIPEAISLRPSRRRNVTLLVGSLGALGVIVAGLVWGLSNRQVGPSTLVRVGGINAYELNLPTLVGLAEGEFTRRGLQIGNLVTGSGSTIRTALINGDVDVALLAFVHTPLARANGHDLRIISAVYNREIFSLLVRNELRDQVRSVQDLRGKKIGVTQPGSGSWAIASAYLGRAGLDPERDVEMISLGGDPASFVAALRAGRVDALSSWEPITTEVVDGGLGYALIRAWDSADVKEWIGAPALSMTLVASEKTIRERRGVLQRFVDAHTAGLQFITSHSSSEIADVLTRSPRTSQYFTGLSRTRLTILLDRIRPGFGDGRISREGFRREMELSVRYSLIEREVPFAEAVDTTFSGSID